VVVTRSSEVFDIVTTKSCSKNGNVSQDLKADSESVREKGDKWCAPTVANVSLLPIG
jgi:hypothetical protein